MTDIRIVSRALRNGLFVLAIVFLGACGGNSGGGGGTGGGEGTGGGGNVTTNLQHLGFGATLSQSEHFTAYGGLSSQAQGVSKSTSFEAKSSTTTLGSESVGK